MKYPIVVLIMVVPVLFACPKKKKCSRSYKVENPLSVYPLKANYQIGDTIWFDLNFSNAVRATTINNLNGSESEGTVQMINTDFHRNFLTFVELIDSTQTLEHQNWETWHKFSKKLAEGIVIRESENGVEYKLIYKNDQYHFKVGLVPKESGRFVCIPSFLLNQSVANPGNEAKITPGCDREIITDVRFPVNRQPDGTYQNNAHLYFDYMEDAVEQASFDTNQSFVFVVNP